MKLSRRQSRIRRHWRVRSTLAGTAERPRICVFRSNRHFSAQVIDDRAGRTLLSVSSVSKATRDGKNYSNRASAERLGRELGEKMKSSGIQKAVFDRGGFLYHGVIETFAEAVRAVDEENHFHF
ncbi:50S ribosomal protein L18 [Candidatus Sumerlaeota bacterium]|nr:50S ribosomal protein L18 [Candidatus Sumerlaeota bacterium]